MGGVVARHYRISISISALRGGRGLSRPASQRNERGAARTRLRAVTQRA